MAQRQAQGSFWSKHSRTGNAVFPDKEDLVTSGEAFSITAVRTGSGIFGPQWYVVIDRNNPELEEGQEEIITFPATAHRQEMYRDLQDAVSNGEQIQAVVRKFTTKNGQTGYELEPADEGEVMDDVPF